jgi:hypothetical protein
LQEAFNEALSACFIKLKGALPALMLIVEVVPSGFTQEMLCEVIAPLFTQNMFFEAFASFITQDAPRSA